VPNLNTSAADAIVITALPFTTTIEAPVDVVEELWWKYTAVEADRELAFRQNTTDETIFNPFTQCYWGDDPGSLTTKWPIPIQDQRRVGIVAVVPGVTYWFKVKDASVVAPNTGVDLTITIESAPTAGAPIGSLFIPTDTWTTGSDGSYTPGVVISAEDGRVLYVTPTFIACERGAVLPNGYSLILDLDEGHFHLYDQTPALVATVAGLDTAFDYECPITSNRDDTFFVNVAGIVYGIDGATGVLTGFTRDIGVQPRNMVVSLGLTNAILLYQEDTSGAPIKAWDLQNDIDLGTWAPGITGRRPLKEALALSDGTFVFGFSKFSAPAALTIRHYDGDGTQLATFDVTLTDGTSSSVPRIAHSLNDPDMFWLRLFNQNELYAGVPGVFTSSYLELDPNTGDVAGAEFEVQGRSYFGYVDPDDPDAELFGPEHSCPFWALPAEMGTPDTSDSDGSDDSDVVEPTTGTVTVVKAALAEPSSDTPVFTFTMSPADAFDPNTFTLEPGDSMVFTDVPAGTGYGVSEAPLSGWDLTSTVVNNGSASVNLTVSVGETVTVTFTNAPDVCECCVSTRLQITNQALAKLGQTRFITDLDEATAEGYTAAELWDLALRASLRHWDWPFATKYAGGADAVDGYMNLVDGSDSDPVVADEWVYAYRYPIDCLHARRLVTEGGAGRGFDPAPQEFRVGRTWNGVNDVPLIYTNVPDAVLEYTALVECSEDFFDALFEDALGWRLAGLMAPGLTRTAKTATECMQMFMLILDQAKAVAAQEGQQPPHGQASWTRSRT